MILPDYDRSILSTMASLLEHYSVPCGYPTLPELDRALAGRPKHVFFLVLDGLGDGVLAENLPEDAYLRRKRVCSVTSVFPSTTAAAMTSYTCGRSPLEHGWLGWFLYMKEYASDVQTFLRTSYYTGQTLGGPYPAGALMPYETVMERIRRAAPGVRVHSVYPNYGSNTDKGAEFSWNVRDFEQLLARLKRIARSGEETFTFAYWPEPDGTMHEKGTRSPEARAKYRELDRGLAALRESLPDSLLVITSDHGLMDPAEWIDLSRDVEIMETLVMPPMMESRATAFYVKAHRREAFQEIFQRKYGEKFLLLPRERVYASGMFGRGTPHGKFDDFIGDFVACAVGESVFAYSLPGKEHPRMRGYHAGLTGDEMNVAVILDRTE